MEALTVWFLVVILSGGPHDFLDRLPVEYPTQVKCSTEGLALFIDRRISLDIYCIEADDEDDLVVIMNGAFNFAGDKI